MSRRRGEFEHRTSIFEGAYRAWSHLGGLAPEDLETKPVADVDPLTHPLEHDSREGHSADSSPREYPYEPLPRAGLSHPYVQAILSPWLGPDADQEAIQLGLTTLRTWWQHRRKGESGSAVAALGTEKMKGVVEGYTRHFFTLAHCLVVNDKEQPPRTLHTKMKELEKIRAKRAKKRTRDDTTITTTSTNNNNNNNNNGANSTIASSNNSIADSAGDTAALTPLERLHHAQQRQLAENGFATNNHSTPYMIDLQGKCIPNKVDMPAVMNQINIHAQQMSFYGASAPDKFPIQAGSSNVNNYGNPNTTPVVFVSPNGDIQIAMNVKGITCAHCVKIVETVLKGCNGNKSPIDGLLDAAADQALHSILIKIDKASNAKRIAFEAARNLSMVGYTAHAKTMSVVDNSADKSVTMDLGALSTAFEVVASTAAEEVFNWKMPCTCPDNGVLREDCAR